MEKLAANSSIEDRKGIYGRCKTLMLKVSIYLGDIRRRVASQPLHEGLWHPSVNDPRHTRMPQAMKVDSLSRSRLAYVALEPVRHRISS